MDAKRAHRVFNFGMAEPYLHGAKIAAGLVNDRRFRAEKRMGAILLRPSSDAGDLFINEARVLSRAEMISVIDAAWKDIISGCPAPPFQPGKQASSHVR